MSVEIKEVESKKDLKAFVNLPFELYKGNEYWVPPIKDEELKSLMPDKNPAFEFCDTKFWLALKDGKVVGRIGAIVNKPYIEKMGEKRGRFTRIEMIDDQEVANALLQTAENWLKEQGMEKVEGPLGFTNLDTQGLLIEGFDYLPSIASVYHLPYYQKLIENYGFEKEIDWVEFRLTLGEQAVNKGMRGAALIKRRYGIEVLEFTKTDELMPYAPKIFEILNDAFSELPFVVPFNQKMIEFYTDKFIKYLNPEFVKMTKLNDELIGFVIGMPSLSKAMQKANGSLFPLGWNYILKAQKGDGVDTMDWLLTGVKKEHQSTGAAVILAAELQNTMLKKGMKYIETTGVFETNHNVISNWKNYEHVQHKRRRCYIKNL
ncbi:MAG TPA: hypothetical protein DIU39_01825 [Flavobacteriales bacterium]|nr:hypothetical protein [Flavobacteriales bacterium]|tara:strand:+ start:19688 stop:20812 length:1125 start_codon:yes stop_codon:yes gene_type:complete